MKSVEEYKKEIEKALEPIIIAAIRQAKNTDAYLRKFNDKIICSYLPNVKTNDVYSLTIQFNKLYDIMKANVENEFKKLTNPDLTIYYILNESFYNNDDYIHYSDVDRKIAFLVNISTLFVKKTVKKYCDKFVNYKIVNDIIIHLFPTKNDNSFIDRLIIEHKELLEKVDKLTEFIRSDKFKDVKPYQQALLQSQLSTMLTYLRILELRIENLTEPKENN